jgi:RNA polymerase sigma-70 factor (ECF subfamily)
VNRRDRFERLYRAHAGAVLAYARRRTAAGAADDVVADVFLVVWRRLDDVPEDALPWLYGVARGVLANRRRGDARRESLRAKLANEAATSTAQEVIVRDDRVLHALAGLSAADREALLLIAWEGLEPARAARALGVRPGAFAMRLHRAKRRFARALMSEDEAVVPSHNATPEVPR